MKHDDDKAVIVLYRTRILEGNLKFIYHELVKKLPEDRIHLVVTENRMNLNLFKEIPMFANARYIILDDYYLPIYLIKPDKRLKVIQLWHAAGAFKKFGYSTVGTKFGPNKDYLKLVPVHSNYTHVYVSSHNVIKYYAEAFHMEENKIFPLGIPRADLFRQKDKWKDIMRKFEQDYPILKDKERVNILLAPTYRAKGTQGESSFNIIDVMSEISGRLHPSILIIFKAHPYMDEEAVFRLEACDNIIVAKSHSINEWMLLSDAFITDYSSAIFEFAILQRPLAHIITDLQDYHQNRGFYQDIQDVSNGDILQDKNQLVHWINHRKKYEHFDTTKMIQYNFDDIEDVSRKIVDHFVQDKKEAVN